MIVKYD